MSRWIGGVYMHFLYVLVFLFLPISAMSWGPLGHRVTAEVSKKFLSVNAKKKINELVPYETMGKMSIYSDFIKSDPSMRKKYNHFHYVSFKKGENYNKQVEKKLKDENILSAIYKFTEILKNPKQKKDKKVFALKMLIHLIGDIHQPLHVGYKKDRGGNNVSVTWFGTKTNLHAVWDTHLVELQKLSSTEYADELVNTHDTTKVKLSNPKRWAKESRDYLTKTYEFKKKKYWEYDYNYIHKKFLDLRLLQAGMRIAGHLNLIFAD